VGLAGRSTASHFTRDVVISAHRYRFCGRDVMETIQNGNFWNIQEGLKMKRKINAIISREESNFKVSHSIACRNLANTMK
jgi:hypothetical protein